MSRAPTFRPTTARFVSALTRQIQRLIRPVLYNIGDCVFHLDHNTRRRWVDGEVGPPPDLGEAYLLAARIAQVLAAGTCDCWRDWDAFGIRNKQTARTACRSRHTLFAWSGDPTFDRWLYTVVVSGNLARSNGFRKGLLAPLVEDPRTGDRLQVNRVLVCSKCKDEVDRTNTCRCVPEYPSVKKATWRVFIRGSRRRWPVRSCEECDQLRFVQEARDLSPCHRTPWKPEPSFVWVPIDWEEVAAERGEQYEPEEASDEDSNIKPAARSSRSASVRKRGPDGNRPEIEG